IYGGDQSLVGQTLVIEGHPFTVAGVATPGFFGDTLRNNPPDLWIPIQHEPMVTGANSLLRQPVSAWLRVIGRLKPGATTDGIARLLLSLAFSVSTFLPMSTRPSPLVLAFAFGVAVITGVLFGAVPTWLATRTDPIEALRGSGRSTGDHSSFTRTALLVLQATLSVVLVAGATMLGRSLNNVQHQDFG